MYLSSGAAMVKLNVKQYTKKYQILLYTDLMQIQCEWKGKVLT